MKNIKFEKLLLLLVLAVFSISVYAQNNNDKLIENETFIFPAGKSDSAVEVTPPTAEDVKTTREKGTVIYVISTQKGDITVELYGDKAPLSVTNFVKLADAGYYDGLIFHRVVPNFVIQGGDPTGTGTGGPGYAIKLEINPELKHVEGALAWARTAVPDSAGSQFYITLSEVSYLNNQYAVFGKVINGMDVVLSIAGGNQMISIKEKVE